MLHVVQVPNHRLFYAFLLPCVYYLRKCLFFKVTTSCIYFKLQTIGIAIGSKYMIDLIPLNPVANGRMGPGVGDQSCILRYIKYLFIASFSNVSWFGR